MYLLDWMVMLPREFRCVGFPGMGDLAEFGKVKVRVNRICADIICDR